MTSRIADRIKSLLAKFSGPPACIEQHEILLPSRDRAADPLPTIAEKTGSLFIEIRSGRLLIEPVSYDTLARMHGRMRWLSSGGAA